MKWRIEDDVLIKDGEPVTDFRTVTSGVYHYSRGQLGVDRRLTIESSLGTTVIASANRRRNESDKMLQLSTKVLEGIGERSPDARIHIGGGRTLVSTSFLIALFIIGIGIWMWTLDGGRDLYWVLWSIPFLLFGTWRAVLARPWNQERFVISAERAIPSLTKGPYRFGRR